MATVTKQCLMPQGSVTTASHDFYTTLQNSYSNTHGYLSNKDFPANISSNGKTMYKFYIITNEIEDMKLHEVLKQ